MPGRMEFSFDLAPQKWATSERSEESPFRILVVGDFSGRQNRGLLEPGDGLATRRLHKVDLDTLEDLPGRLGAVISIPAGDTGTVDIPFPNLDAFHPDHLCRTVPTFTALTGLRKRLQDPATAQEAIRELGLDEPQEPAEPKPSAEADDALFSRLLGRSPSEPAAARTPGGFDVSDFLRRVVKEHVVPDAPPGVDAALAQVNQAMTAELRRVLGDPAFQSMETVWRSLDMLVRGIETDDTLEVGLLDAGRDELTADAGFLAENPARSGLHRLLVEAAERPGAKPWSVIVLGFRMGGSPEDLTLLAAMAALGSRLGAPVLAGVSPTVVGAHSWKDLAEPTRWEDPADAQAWNAFRATPPAGWVAAFLPRLLLRLPYGATTDALEVFPFEECPTPGDADALLLGSAAFGAAKLLAQSFRARGWDMEPGDIRDLDDIPAYVYERDGERRLMPAAGISLSERAADALLQRGICPLMSAADRSLARVVRFQSAASPPAALPGRWK